MTINEHSYSNNKQQDVNNGGSIFLLETKWKLFYEATLDANFGNILLRNGDSGFRESTK